MIGLVALACLMVAACQATLYSNLSEADANEMVAVLMSNGISAEKSARSKDGFSVNVPESNMLRALTVLREAGYPRASHDSVGRVFQKTGIMSSPFEERVRYIYALSEDVARTLAYIDGVVTARVHIVMPEAPQLGRPVKPSSAAVFIRHRPRADLDFLVPQIRRLVSSAIEGLEYQAVTVVLTEAQPNKPMANGPANPERAFVNVLPGLAVREEDAAQFWQIAIGVLVLITLLLAVAAGAVVMWLRGRRSGRPTATQNAPALVEPS
jgi:type III secretion protein J